MDVLSVHATVRGLPKTIPMPRRRAPVPRPGTSVPRPGTWYSDHRRWTPGGVQSEHPRRSRVVPKVPGWVALSVSAFINSSWRSRYTQPSGTLPTRRRPGAGESRLFVRTAPSSRIVISGTRTGRRNVGPRPESGCQGSSRDSPSSVSRILGRSSALDAARSRTP